MKITAVSDAHVPVNYLVREGPPEVDGDILKFLPIPPHAKFPVRVTVVAWQYERPVEPKLKTAEPVERVFNLLNGPYLNRERNHGKYIRRQKVCHIFRES